MINTLLFWLLGFLFGLIVGMLFMYDMLKLKGMIH